MSSSVATATRQPKGKALDLPLMGEARRSQPTVKTNDEWLWILPVIAQAMDRVMSRKEAAILMGMDEGHLSRQLRGDGHLSVPRLGALGERFWIALRDELAVYYDLNDPAAEAKQAAELITRGMTMLLARVK
jgi:hypothetical protein